MWRLLIFLSGVSCYHDPHFADGRSTIVHLFEWKWKDIGEECEFLKDKGYGAVQVSPPNENLILKGRPWYERYQPVSYVLKTRSGDEDDFEDMTKRCNAAGVRIYVDAVINHMSGGDGSGTASNKAEASKLNFPGVPYNSTHFHRRCSIDFNDPRQVRECELLGLTDLNQKNEYVRGKIVDFMNHLIKLGVSGFRIDAAKHMYPEDLKAIYDRLDDLPGKTRPFIYQEVAGLGYGDVINREDYVAIGNIMEFRYGLSLSKVFRKKDKARYLDTWGPQWGLLNPGNKAVVFIDNHDNQRDGTPDILTYKQSKQYKMAVAFMLAHDYPGIPRVMSSYEFVDSQTSPPQDRNGNLISPGFNRDGSCTNGYICEHRWRQVYSMVSLKKVALNTTVSNWQAFSDHQVAFCRGDKAFIVFSDGDLDQEVNACVPRGTYCDVISGSLMKGKCSGKEVHVDGSGRARIVMRSNDEDGVMAIHLESKRD